MKIDNTIDEKSDEKIDVLRTEGNIDDLHEDKINVFYSEKSIQLLEEYLLNYPYEDFNNEIKKIIKTYLATKYPDIKEPSLCNIKTFIKNSDEKEQFLMEFAIACQNLKLKQTFYPEEATFQNNDTYKDRYNNKFSIKKEIVDILSVTQYFIRHIPNCKAYIKNINFQDNGNVGTEPKILDIIDGNNFLGPKKGRDLDMTKTLVNQKPLNYKQHYDILSTVVIGGMAQTILKKKNNTDVCVLVPNIDIWGGDEQSTKDINKYIYQSFANITQKINNSQKNKQKGKIKLIVDPTDFKNATSINGANFIINKHSPKQFSFDLPEKINGRQQHYLYFNCGDHLVWIGNEGLEIVEQKRSNYFDGSQECFMTKTNVFDKLGGEGKITLVQNVYLYKDAKIRANLKLDPKDCEFFKVCLQKKKLDISPKNIEKYETGEIYIKKTTRTINNSEEQIQGTETKKTCCCEKCEIF